jgi:DNA-binding Lrp family transcriptional regulator
MTRSGADDALLMLLRDNARASTASLARALGLSRSTVQSRLERLERDGTIQGYTVRLGDLEARQVQAHVSIALEANAQAAVERTLRSLPAVTSLMTVSGLYDLIAMVGADSTAALDRALDQLRACPGVKTTTTAVVLSRRFDR